MSNLTSIESDEICSVRHTCNSFFWKLQ
jgi:hypothetical protein